VFVVCTLSETSLLSQSLVEYELEFLGDIVAVLKPRYIYGRVPRAPSASRVPGPPREEAPSRQAPRPLLARALRVLELLELLEL
jgi:hypothetical protein